jgi:hypothetical protein
MRAAARFSIVAYCALAALASVGFAALESRVGSPAKRLLLFILTVVLIAVEYGSGPMITSVVAQEPSSIYKTLRGLGPGVVVELPLPRLDALPGQEAIYELWSIDHWFPLVNGYSGYYPPEYFATVLRMYRFPDAMSLSRLEALGVRYIIVHRAFLPRDQFEPLLARMIARPELKVQGRFTDPIDQAVLFQLVR